MSTDHPPTTAYPCPTCGARGPEYCKGGDEKGVCYYADRAPNRRMMRAEEAVLLRGIMQ